jgi:hypothetical protein
MEELRKAEGGSGGRRERRRLACISKEEEDFGRRKAEVVGEGSVGVSPAFPRKKRILEGGRRKWWEKRV